jgi:hypothetical protein
MSTAPQGSGLLVIERLLRDRDGVWRQISEERDLSTLTWNMLASSGVALFFFGAVLGASHSALQAAVSAVKLPLLFLITLAICLPTLYLFNLVFGARLSVRQALALVLVTITVTAALTLAFAPISLFFLVTAGNYSFYKILNVAILTLAASVGLRFLTQGMAALNAHMQARRLIEEAAAAPVAEQVAAPVGAVEQPEPVAVVASSAAPGAEAVGTAGANGQQPVPAALPAQPVGVPFGVLPNGQQVPLLPNGQPHPGFVPVLLRPQPARVPAQQLPPGQRPASMGLLYIWILLFGFVGTQLGWTLRPFFGSPDEPFQIVREINGNFYVDIVDTLGRLF